MKLRNMKKALQGNVFSLLDLLTVTAWNDYRGVPTAVCPCGSDRLLVAVMFDEGREIADYLTEGWCTVCGSMLTVCTADPAEVERYGGFHVD